MQAVDGAAQATVGLDALIDRAGWAVARAALGMLGGAYGRRVVVVAGKGHNGDDGRVAAARLAERGVAVRLVDPSGGGRLPPCDLVVDAAYGTGFRGTYDAPVPAPGTPVLAVDIPSGVDGDTGAAGDGAVAAVRTVTFAAYKPGLLLGRGAELAGEVEVADIGLDVSSSAAAVVEDGDVAALLPRRRREAHKWQAAVGVVAGSPGMHGSAELCSGAALRAGAGYVRLGIPGATALPGGEVVATALPAGDWADAALAWTERCRALVVGPGLGRDEATVAAVRRLVAAAPVPVLVDADGLYALGEKAAEVISGRSQPTVLTPHEGEFRFITGAAPGPDRLEAVRSAAAGTGATVLLKGSTTVVAGPDGEVLISTSGGPQLATAGTGDVLSGVIGAFLALGLGAPTAAGLGAHVHGRAGAGEPPIGLVAGRLVQALPATVSRLAGAGG
ncbi:MAG TPA: NAD(P)H-hydrate dehydratase [Acidimicrobiales bacterium]|nr:NAD(P)H-hydrate dehydratase [Acidimicrobiales bacterium]